LDGRTIDWDRIEAQTQTDPDGHFSFQIPGDRLPQIECHTAYTNADTHQIIRDNLDRSPLFSGQIEGRGPRYCPSIEDKIVRFADKERHQLFLEPEGLDTHRIYVNGLATSLPSDVQLAIVHSIVGLEKAEILQDGYAVEYDFADPRDLDHGLQHKAIPGLYLAGQVNGTSGYEEAAAQGLIAGISAAQGEAFVLGRDQAYIGVLIDDLVTRGVGGEPYRMFSSRAEHRLLLREDNADRRLMPTGRKIGLVDDQAWEQFEGKLKAIDAARLWCDSTVVRPNAEVVARLVAADISVPKKPVSVAVMLRRPTMTWDLLTTVIDGMPALSPVAASQVETDIKYAGYLVREEARSARTRKMESVVIPEDMEFNAPGLSNEVGERLRAARPATLGAAARLPGITPAAIDMLAVLLARRRTG
jgi:tRNA uridine 5-carboxymethylaminomethyl modification enzyme